MLKVRVIKDQLEMFLTSEENVLRRWMQHFEELINVENERDRRLDDVDSDSE